MINQKIKLELKKEVKLLIDSIDNNEFYGAKAWVEDINEILDKHIKEDLKNKMTKQIDKGIDKIKVAWCKFHNIPMAMCNHTSSMRCIETIKEMSIEEINKTLWVEDIKKEVLK